VGGVVAGTALRAAVAVSVVWAGLAGLVAPAAHAVAGPVALVAWGDMGTQQQDVPATALATLNGYIGRQSNGSYPLAGNIDDVAIYAAALPGTTVVRHYFAGVNGPAPS
jgi:hypothetical protein